MGFLKSRWDRAGISNTLSGLGLDAKSGDYVAESLPATDLKELQLITNHLDKVVKYVCLSIAAVEYCRFYLNQEVNKDTLELNKVSMLLQSTFTLSTMSDTLISIVSKAEQDGRISQVTSETLFGFIMKYRD